MYRIADRFAGTHRPANISSTCLSYTGLYRFVLGPLFMFLGCLAKFLCTSALSVINSDATRS